VVPDADNPKDTTSGPNALIVERALMTRTTSARLRRPEVNRSYLIPALCKAIVIIKLLEESDGPLNVEEISKRTGISKTTTYRFLRTLSAYDYLPQGDLGIYSLAAASYINPKMH
jgi:Fic family protein